MMKDELAAQNARKESFERRGLAVVTTAGTLATLLFGVATFSTTGSTRPLPRDAKEFLVVALVIFVAAGFLALLTNLPSRYELANLTTTLNRSQRDPADNEAEALRWSARVYEKALRTAKRKNTHKGELLAAALVVEMAAIGFVALAVAHAI
jgi:hypothetical protein